MSKTIVIAAGGSGGHIFPAQALADEMLKLKWNVIFVTDERGLSFVKKFDSRISISFFKILSPSKLRILKLPTFLFLLIISIYRSLKILSSSNAFVVTGFGGYPTFPVLTAAQILGIKKVIHEQNAVLGRVNKIFSRVSSLIVYGIKPDDDSTLMPSVKFLGTPVRSSILEFHGSSYNFEPSGEIVLLVLGGSQGATFISRVFVDAVKALPSDLYNRLRIFHQCRLEDRKFIKTVYDDLGIKSEIEVFFNDLGKRLAESHLIISRAGASTVSEICIVGRPSVLIPLPTALGNHQFLNAVSMEKTGGAKLANQRSLTGEHLSEEIILLLSDSNKLREMASSALNNGKPDAARGLAENIVQFSLEG